MSDVVWTLNSIAISIESALSRANELPDIPEREILTERLRMLIREIEMYERALGRRRKGA
jgi:hypothetical protein